MVKNHLFPLLLILLSSTRGVAFVPLRNSVLTQSRAAFFLRSSVQDTAVELRKEATTKSERSSSDFDVPLGKAAEMWTVSVSAEDNIERKANIPYMDSKVKDYYVTDLEFEVGREGGLGMELLELAGGRDDGVGMTIVENVIEGSNAEKAGIMAGDSLSALSVPAPNGKRLNAVSVECLDFDSTIAQLSSFPDASEVPRLVVGVKRLQRWPKVKVLVEYPKSQCAEGVDNVKELSLFAGENLKRAMQTRGIILDDPDQPTCDFCAGKCVVRIGGAGGFQLLNPMGMTEEKLMKRNPRCRLSCKTVVGHNMQEGELRVRVNVMQKD